jgi:putative tricarboxylic transport membrane protein
LVAAIATLASGAHAATPLDELKIIAPASVGGGWDQTAHAVQQVLQVSGLAKTVEVTNSPGAGGTIGLAQFINAQKGQGDALLVGGLCTIGAIRTNHATVSLLLTTPIARLTGEYEVIAVPASSEFKTLDELVQALRADPGAVSWAGGSGGGADQLLLGLVARAIGVEPVQIPYVPFAGGGEVASALLADEFAAGVSGYAELEPHLRSGRLRALALSSEKRVPGIPTPTLKEQGVDVTLINWRAVFAPPGISEAQRERLSGVIDALVKQPAWKAILAKYHWVDLYLSGDEFTRFVHAEHARVEAGPDPRGIARIHPAAIWNRWTRMFKARPILSASLLGSSLLIILVLSWQGMASRKREGTLTQNLAAARQDAKRRTEEAEDLLKGLGEQIDKQFETWGLTSAESEVALLMLKGLRHKEIAGIRGTSERTVRQQALTIYKKARLDGRTDLAAYFLEDLLLPQKPPAARSA